MPQRKGFFIRLLAAVIDTVAMVAIGFLFDVFVAANLLSEFVSTLLTALSVIAYSLFDVFLAGTPGKLAVGLAIANANGTPAPCAVLSHRWSTKYFPLLCTLLFVVTGFGPFWILGGFTQFLVIIGCFFVLNDDKRAWHDKWARTAVFSRRDIYRPNPGFPVIPPPPPPPPAPSK